MSSISEVIFVNKHNQTDGIRTVLRTKMYMRALTIMVLAAAAVLVVGAGVGAADEVNVTLAGHFGGETGVVAVSGNYAYIGQGQDLVVLDISSPALPVELGRVMTTSIMDVAVSGDYAYVADGSNGLTIIDVSNKSAPALAGSYDTGKARGVAVSGGYAYVADYSDGLVIVDVSNKSAPTLAGGYDTTGGAVIGEAGAVDVAVSGGYAYVADWWNGLVILRTDASGADTTPPTLTITSPAPNTTTHTPVITITGTASDASGIASVTVNGEPANGTLDWSANVTLTEGENLITVIASDGEGLNTTVAVTVHYEPLRGDLNNDGILDSTDAAIALEIAVGSRPFDDAADVSGDGKVTSLDALTIMQAAAGR